MYLAIRTQNFFSSSSNITSVSIPCNFSWTNELMVLTTLDFYMQIIAREGTFLKM